MVNNKIENLWNEYKSLNNEVGNKYDAWAFGDDADYLANLVDSGEKTATSSAFPLYAVDNEPLPKENEYSVILNSKDEPVCIIKNTKVTIMPFKDITEEHACKEGEGDKSLRYWREVHERFFTHCMEEAGMKFDENMKVVCEEFEVVFKNGEY